jgi:hypothetical protein
MGCLKDASSTKETKQTEKAQPGGARDSIEKAINVTGFFFLLSGWSRTYTQVISHLASRVAGPTSAHQYLPEAMRKLCFHERRNI